MNQAIGTPSGALLSPCRQYRYLLWRTWDLDKPKMLWIMLNPSTADAEVNDATISVCMGRARLLGYGGIVVANLFALRATHPQALYADGVRPICGDDMIGRYTRFLMDVVEHCGVVVCAWGTHGKYLGMGPSLLRVLHEAGIQCWALKRNADGSPAHPLRIPYSQPLMRL